MHLYDDFRVSARGSDNVTSWQNDQCTWCAFLGYGRWCGVFGRLARYRPYCEWVGFVLVIGHLHEMILWGRYEVMSTVTVKYMI